MNDEQIVYLPLEKIEATRQPRTEFSEQSLRGLADTMTQVGLLQPIRVRREGEIYVVVAGERRLRAAKMSGRFTTIGAIVEQDELNAAAILHRQMVENCQKEDLAPPDMARGIKELMEQTGGTAADVASKLGFTRGTVAKLLALVDLPESIQNADSRR